MCFQTRCFPRAVRNQILRYNDVALGRQLFAAKDSYPRTGPELANFCHIGPVGTFKPWEERHKAAQASSVISEEHSPKPCYSRAQAKAKAAKEVKTVKKSKD